MTTTENTMIMDMTDHQETPDIEVEADIWEDQQDVLRQLAMEEEGTYPDGTAITDDPYANMNSCDALCVMDGVAVSDPDEW